MKVLRRNKANSESGSNDSEDSALVSLGNTSFGFNFDSEEGMSNSSPPNDSEQNSEEDLEDSKPPATSKAQGLKPASGRHPPPFKPSGPPLTASSLSNLASQIKSTAARAGGGRGHSRQPQVTESSSSAPSVSTSSNTCNGSGSRGHAKQISIQPPPRHQQQQQRKRKSSDNESGGYNTDDDEEANEKASWNGNPPGPMMIGSSETATSMDHSEDRPGKKKKVNDKRREERNAREKERSLRISQQINELRGLLSNGGVVVPKGTKSSVLTEAANYIRMLQQHQYRSEIDRQQLVQQMQLIGSGAHGVQAAATIRHVAAQNGVWSLGNFGGVPPKSAMTFYQPNASEESSSSTASVDQNNDAVAALGALKMEGPDYRFVFNSCGFAMAIASMGGAFLDCNHLFSQLTQYTKQELCSQTIFNLTERQDLQRAFDEISQLISSPVSETDAKPVVLKCSLKNRGDLGLSVSLVRGEDGIAKCFCVALIKTQLDMGRPVPISFDALEAQSAETSQPTAKDDGGMDASPAFTSG
jgi:PAS domain-containing protein